MRNFPCRRELPTFHGTYCVVGNSTSHGELLKSRGTPRVTGNSPYRGEFPMLQGTLQVAGKCPCHKELPTSWEVLGSLESYADIYVCSEYKSASTRTAKSNTAQKSSPLQSQLQSHLHQTSTEMLSDASTNTFFLMMLAPCCFSNHRKYTVTSRHWWHSNMLLA